MELVQQGLMNLALAAFTKVAEQMMHWEVRELVGAKHQANQSREKMRWGKRARAIVWWAGRKCRCSGRGCAISRQREIPLRQLWRCCNGPR